VKRDRRWNRTEMPLCRADRGDAAVAGERRFVGKISDGTHFRDMIGAVSGPYPNSACTAATAGGLSLRSRGPSRRSFSASSARI